MGKVRPASGLSPIFRHLSFVKQTLLPHEAESYATHCRLTSPTPCYRPPCYFPIYQRFPTAVDYLPHVPGYMPLLPFSFAFSYCYLPQILSFFIICYAFLATLHAHAFVLKNDGSRLNKHSDKPISLLARHHHLNPKNVLQAASTSRVGNKLTFSPDNARITVHAPGHSQSQPSPLERLAGCQHRRLQKQTTAVARFVRTFVRVAGCEDFAGVDPGRVAERRERRVNRGGGIGDRESLSVVDHLLRIDVVFCKMLMSYTLGMTSSAESAAEKINYSA
ncbi:hypothetical protein V8E53_002956 [Lactarius tabidus]